MAWQPPCAIGAERARSNREVDMMGKSFNKTVTRRSFLTRIGRATAGTAGLAILWRPEVGSASSNSVPASAFGADGATAWVDLSLALGKGTPRVSPPLGSRAFGYTAVALYESLVPGMPDHRSLAGQLGDLSPAPGPSDSVHHWPTVANAALASILRSLFPTALDPNQAAVNA